MLKKHFLRYHHSRHLVFSRFGSKRLGQVHFQSYSTTNQTSEKTALKNNEPAKKQPNQHNNHHYSSFYDLMNGGTLSLKSLTHLTEKYIIKPNYEKYASMFHDRLASEKAKLAQKFAASFQPKEENGKEKTKKSNEEESSSDSFFSQLIENEENNEIVNNNSQNSAVNRLVFCF